MFFVNNTIVVQWADPSGKFPVVSAIVPPSEKITLKVPLKGLRIMHLAIKVLHFRFQLLQFKLNLLHIKTTSKFMGHNFATIFFLNLVNFE